MSAEARAVELLNFDPYDYKFHEDRYPTSQRPGDEAAKVQGRYAAIDIVNNSLAIKRMGTVTDLIGASSYLLSDDASWVTGQILAVDGGQTFRLER